MMNYPYITMINQFNDQLLIEGCSSTNNFKIIVNYDYLFDEEKIEIQKTPKNYRSKILTFFELHVLFDIKLEFLFLILHLIIEDEVKLV